MKTARLVQDYRGVKILPVKGFENYYVSEDGKVYAIKEGRLHEMSPTFVESSAGLTYKFLKLSKNTIKYSKLIHRVVYETFNDVLLTRKQKIFFVDNNPFNCHINNLTLQSPTHELMKGEEWIEGYEGRYFRNGMNVWSVVENDSPKKLSPADFGYSFKYTLYDEKGKPVNYYLRKHKESL